MKEPEAILSVIVPVFNERETVQEILRRITAVELKKEIVVVDDGSTDGTTEILRKLKAEDALDREKWNLTTNVNEQLKIAPSFSRTANLRPSSN